MDQKSDSLHTSQLILDIAQRLVQTRGFNAFSYADIARALSVSTASLHYHFASKSDLGVRLIQRYEDSFERTLGVIDLEGGRGRGEVTKLCGHLFTRLGRRTHVPVWYVGGGICDSVKDHADGLG